MPPRRIPSKRTGILILSVQVLLLLGLPGPAQSKREHLVHFPNTAYELNIYKIYGKNPGKTLLLIGGIQGNEPGGFLSADLYADMRLEKGNLIVVPRANFYSIITNQRGPHGDMNRKFTPEDVSSSMEDRIVAILKDLIRESDYLLNLHDGAGYYYPRYIDKWRNPTRFGQAVIADCREYAVPGEKRVILLQEMAQRVIDEVNLHIPDDLYRFHFMNTRTGETDSPHKEQRKSATYYALTRHHIPAFGVETSKFLPTMDLKVRFHNLVINAFMRLFDIVPESPGRMLDPPVLKYLVVSINGNTPIVIRAKEALEVSSGDSINVTHIESNYVRGLSLDILGYGELNDYRKDFTIVKDTTMIVRKDNQKCAEIPIRVSAMRSGGEKRSEPRPRIEHFVIETGNNRLLVSNGETLTLVKGEKLKILDVLPSPPATAGVKVNLKGFVGDRQQNLGEDRGYLVDTAVDLMERFSTDRKGESYEVLATQGEKSLARMTVKLIPPRMDFLILRVNDQRHVLLRPENRVSLSLKDRICLEEVQTNLGAKSELHLSINGHKVKPGETRLVKDLCKRNGGSQTATLQKGSIHLGRIFIAAN
ncbi:MAG: M14/M99 family metallopeptidase [Thermodesulfobacteriota bacterium]